MFGSKMHITRAHAESSAGIQPQKWEHVGSSAFKVSL